MFRRQQCGGITMGLLLMLMAAMCAPRIHGQSLPATIDAEGTATAADGSKHRFTVTGAKATLTPIPLPPPATQPAPLEPPKGPTLVRLVLVDAAAKQDLGPVVDGMTIEQGRAINFRAELTNALSVTFQLSGEGEDARLESSAPFYAFGDVDDGTPKLWTPPAGERTLVVTPFALKAAGGVAGPSQTFRFTIVAKTPTTQPIPPPVPDPAPVIAGRPSIESTRPAGTLTARSRNQVEADLKAGKRTFAGLHITGGTLRLNGYSGVVFENCLIDAGGSGWAVRCDDGQANPAARVFRNCELRNMADEAVYGGGFTADACYVHHSGGDGFKPKSHSVIQRCYVTHLGTGAGAHADGVQIRGHSNIVIRGNYFDMPKGVAGTASNAGVFAQLDLKDLTIDGNWFRGGNFTVCVYDDGPDDKTSRVTNNVFYRGSAKYGFGQTKGTVTWSGNIDEHGKPVGKGEK